MPKPLIGPDGEVPELGDAFFAGTKRGRPAMLPGARKVRMNLMLDGDVARALEAQPNKSAFVNAAVRKARKR